MTALAGVLALAVGPRPAQALQINVVYYGAPDSTPHPKDISGGRLLAITNAAADRWEAIITDLVAVDVAIYWYNPGQLVSPDRLAEGISTAYNGAGNPTAGYIHFNNAKDFYFDETPHSDSEYTLGQTHYQDLDPGTQSEWYSGSPPGVLEVSYAGQAKDTAPQDAKDDFDLLSVAMHELGHVLGLNADAAPTYHLQHWYPVSPGYVGGASMTIREDLDHLEHLPHDLALMEYASAGWRRNPGVTDILAVGVCGSWGDIELPRREFLGGPNLNDPGAWVGGKTPQGAYDAYVRAHNGVAPIALTSGGMLCRNLHILDGSWIAANHTLQVVETTTIDGTNAAPGLTTRVRVQTGGSLETDDLVIGPNAVLELLGDGITGGYVEVDGNARVAADGRIEGEGMMFVQGKLVNDGLIRADGAKLTLSTWSSGAIWDLDGAGGGALEVIDGDMFIYGAHIGTFHGTVTIGPDRKLDVAHPWWLGSGSTLTLDGGSSAPATLLSADTVLRGSVVVDRTGIVEGKTTFKAPAQVSVPDANDVLLIYDDVTFDGGSYAGSGTIKQMGNVDIDSDTTIDVATYDWGNSSIFQDNQTVVSAGATLTINSPTTGTPGNPYHGTVLVSGGTLAVNTASFWMLPEPTGGPMWHAGGTLNLAESGGQPARVQGQPLMVKRKIDAILGTSIIEADLVTTPTAEIQVRNGAELQLAGHTTLNGGNLHGNGTLSQHGDITVSGDTTITTAVFDWGNSSGTTIHTLAIHPGARLNVNSPTTGDGSNSFRGAIDVDSGTLAVNTLAPWTLAASGGATLPEGALTLTRTGFDKPSVTGIASMVVGGALNINANEAFFESTMVLLGGTVSFLANGEMQHVAPVEFHSGTFDHTDKAGWFRTSPSASLSWSGSANIAVEGSSGGSLTFDLASGTSVTVPTGTPTLTIKPGATVNVGGATDPFTDSLDPSCHVDVVNDSTTSLNIVTTTAIGSLSGGGNTYVGPGASLSAASIGQHRVTVDAGGALRISARGGSILVQDILDNAGLVSFSGDADLLGDIVNKSDILVSPASTACFFNAVTHSGRIFVPVASTATFLGPVTGNGRFTGKGTVAFLGEVSPGSSIGTMVFEGGVLFGDNAILEMEIGGAGAGVEYDRLLIGGSAALAGTIELITLPGLWLEPGQSFDLLTVKGDVSGAFQVDTAGVEPRFLFGLQYVDGAVRLHVLAIPEPATLALLGLGALGLRRRARRRQRM